MVQNLIGDETEVVIVPASLGASSTSSSAEPTAAQAAVADAKKKTLIQTAIGIGLSVGVLFATVWIVSKAWKKGQD